MIQILYLLFMALMLTIFFIYKNLFLHKKQNNESSFCYFNFYYSVYFLLYFQKFNKRLNYTLFSWYLFDFL